MYIYRHISAMFGTCPKRDGARGNNYCFRVLVLSICLLLFILLWPWKLELVANTRLDENGKFKRFYRSSAAILHSVLSWKRGCHFFNCFEVNYCFYNIHDIIQVYIYPEDDPQLPRTSLEYQEILETIRRSRYYEPHPLKACVFVSSIDTLNQRAVNISLISQLLSDLPWWRNGTNHVIFSMLPGQQPHYNSTPDFSYGKSVLANGAFTRQTYRIGFDISLPVFNSLTRKKEFVRYHSNQLIRHYKILVLIQSGANSAHVTLVKNIYETHKEKESVLILGSCDQCECHIHKRCDVTSKDKHWMSYPDVLQEAEYCLILPGPRLATPDLADILMMGCVPVIIRNYQLVLPFAEVLDWTSAAVLIWLDELSQLMPILKNGALRQRQRQILYFYTNYFRSMAAITMTTLDILNGRVFPFNAHSYEYWNVPDYLGEWNVKHRRIRLPSSSMEEGFTAVILAYDRIEKLFRTIRNVAQVNSLTKVLVVWNNSYKAPPPLSDWPIINKPVQVIRTKQNKLSNRFYPYPEIETAAILSLDDDITMISSDEIEFGFKAWLEYPDRLVGYPGRVHRYDGNANEWKYDSEWTNNVSVILTGAAFYHKYYHYHYTFLLPKFITNWVDKHFNCEDIVFNFMISNLTGFPPLKVTPRKRFKCVSCKKDGLFTHSAHFLERNRCINLFAKHFGGITLKAIKYRLDPVLYKVETASDKAFPKVGEL